MASADQRNAMKIKTVADARRLARRRLPSPVFDYIDGAAGGEITANDNRSALESVRFRPRFASTIGTQPRELATTILGDDLSMPVIVGPVGFTRSMHPSGDAAGLAAAAKARTAFCHSSMSGQSISQLASTATSPYWFQLYFLGGRQGAEQLVDRAAAAGCKTLVVTIDTPVPGNRERDLQYGAALPVRINRQTMRRMAPFVIGHPQWLFNTARDHFTLSLANSAGLTREGAAISEDESLLYWVVEPPTWSDIKWIRERWKGNLVIKGVVTGDDARLALDYGANAVIVSNHGGRQLDQVANTLDALVDVVDAVAANMTVMVDGGIRRGSDVAAALCLGAQAVLLGRAWVYGLSAAGEFGVTRVLDIIKADLIRTMQLLGARTLGELNRSFVEYSTRSQ
jgi:isopentenyl diphosphate isomerase/L-lactate dehydrogenase-like FMN-dependent dehydrogenase